MKAVEAAEEARFRTVHTQTGEEQEEVEDGDDDDKDLAQVEEPDLVYDPAEDLFDQQVIKID